jgi:negative regulator of sigma E activity
MGSEEIEGRAATQVRSKPKDEKTADYAYRITWVDDDTKLPLKEEYFDHKDVVVRRFVASKIEMVDDVPTATERTMTNVKRNRSTTIRFADVSYEAPLDAGKFNERLLKNPPAAYRR